MGPIDAGDPIMLGSTSTVDGQVGMEPFDHLHGIVHMAYFHLKYSFISS